MLSQEQVISEFEQAGALLEGHFVLSSGLHSPRYLQCARVMMDAARGARLCSALKEKLLASIDEEFDLVASPAMGGVIVGYEMGRQLEVPSIFFERVDGTLTLRRGFNIPQGAKCLMMEDIVTTGLSSRECIEAINNEGGNVIAAACLIDRTGGKAEVGAPLISLAELEIPVYKADELPEQLAGLTIDKPGSRNLK